MGTMISPNYSDEKLENPDIEDLVDVFEDRIRCWVLNPAKKLAQLPNGQISAFSLALTYFEGIWSYIEGEDSNRKSQQFSKLDFAQFLRVPISANHY